MSPNPTKTAELERRAHEIARALHGSYPDANCALGHESPFQLLVSTILSAQCTDERVNLVTPKLFARFPTPESILRSKPGELESIIRSTGFFNAKAKNIRGACRILVERFGGEVPRTMDELLLLPGVARKTANVVLGTAFGVKVGFVVDTHVTRLARRLGLTQQNDPVKIEDDLCRALPGEDWVFLAHALITHGRRVCSARAPACDRCSIAELCPSRGLAADHWKGASAKASGRPGGRRAAQAATPRRARGRTARAATPGSPRSGPPGSDSKRSRRRS